MNHISASRLTLQEIYEKITKRIRIETVRVWNIMGKMLVYGARGGRILCRCAR